MYHLGSYKNVNFVLPTSGGTLGRVGQLPTTTTGWLGLGAVAVAAWYLFFRKK